MANEHTDPPGAPTRSPESAEPVAAIGWSEPAEATGPKPLPARPELADGTGQPEPAAATPLPAMAEPTIRCTGLTKRYGDVIAIDGVDLAVCAGEVFGFLGPNGSGKTTTLRILAGLATASAGRAHLSGTVGAMIEEPAFYPWLTGRANLEVLALTGSPTSPTSAVLDRVGLTEVADRKVKAYSQGMRQRLGLAAALLRDPRVLLLDEPTNGLDPAGIRDFRALFRALAAEGRTVFLSSHLLSEVERVCDRVAVVHRGRVVRQGRVADLGADLETAYLNLTEDPA